jgi:cell division protein FtsB
VQDRFTQLSQERTDLVTEITTARRKIDDLQARAASLEAEATTLRRENEVCMSLVSECPYLKAKRRRL